MNYKKSSVTNDEIWIIGIVFCFQITKSDSSNDLPNTKRRKAKTCKIISICKIDLREGGQGRHCHPRGKKPKQRLREKS